MQDDHALRLVTLACAGAGLLLAAGGLLLTRRAAAGWRLLAVLVPFGAALALGTAWNGDPAFATRIGAPIFVIVGAGLALMSRRIAAGASRALAVVGRPGVVAGLFGAVGLATVFGSVAWYELEDERRTDDHMLAIGMGLEAVALHPDSPTSARTDRGSEVRMRVPATPRSPAEITAAERAIFASGELQNYVIRRGPGTDATNCHGWVFTAGRHWVNGSDVDRILRENGYATVTEPRPGDVVIYRDPTGEPSHTGLIRYVTPGQPILVESKWSWMGVFLHPIDASVYGTNYAFYRSPRTGHVLTGLGGPESPSTATPTGP